MLSLKYKNIVKKALYEKNLSKEIAKNNMDIIQEVYNTLENIKVDDKIYIRKYKNSQLFYVLDENTQQAKLSIFNNSKTFMSPQFKNNPNNKNLNEENSKKYVLKGVGIEILNSTYYLQQIKDRGFFVAWDKSENITDIMQIPEVKNFFNYGCHSYQEVSNYLNSAYTKNGNILNPDNKINLNKNSLKYNHNTEEAKSIPPEQIDNITRIPENTEEKAFIPKSWKATKEFMFDPQHIIGDATYRSIPQLKSKINLNLQAFMKDESSIDIKAWEVVDKETKKKKKIVKLNKGDVPPQYVAASFLQDLVTKTCDGKDPFIKIEMNDAYKPPSNSKYINGMKLPQELNFKKTEPGYAKEVVKLLDDKPTEIISPIVVLKLDDKIFPNDGGTTKNTLVKVFGGKPEEFNNGLISYPAASEELVDSYCAIKNGDKYSLLGVSTKGGYDGRGAQASTISLFRMIYKDPNSIPGKLNNKFSTGINITTENKLLSSVKDILNDFGKKLFDEGIKGSSTRDCQVTLSMLTLFGGSMVKEHMAIFEKLKNNKIFGLNENIKTLTEFCNFINTNYKITDCIMNILDSQKYKFAQLNCTPSLKNNVFGFDYKIQYPAHFEGTVSFEPRGKGIGFHILGKIG